jgi:hypothetical protein
LYYPGGNETGAKPNLITCITEIFLSAGQAIRSAREGGMDRLITAQISPGWVALSSSQPGGPPCWVISLASGLIGCEDRKLV